MKFSGILIGSENPTQLKEYYTKLLGKPTWDEAEGGYFGWQFGDSGVMFGPHSDVKGKNREPGRILWNLEAADVQGEFDKLKAAGATVVKEPYDPGESSGMLIATFSDPDNNYFQLMSPMGEGEFEKAEEMAAAKK